MTRTSVWGLLVAVALAGCGPAVGATGDAASEASVETASADVPRPSLTDPAAFGFVVHVRERAFYVLSTDVARSLGGVPTLLARANSNNRTESIALAPLANDGVASTYAEWLGRRVEVFGPEGAVGFAPIRALSVMVRTRPEDSDSGWSMSDDNTRPASDEDYLASLWQSEFDKSMLVAELRLEGEGTVEVSSATPRDDSCGC